MDFTFDRNKKTIKEIYDEFTKGKLIIDTSYQRRKVWLPQDKVRLIETILMGLIVPEVFFWPSKINADTGEIITHIVDGQQRINAIVEFITGDFELSKKYLMCDDIKTKYGDKSFVGLVTEGKERIWTYKFSVVDIDRKCNKADITQMFYRLNLTNYSLNPQEKRNSLESSFGDKAESLSGLDFWKNNKVFSSADARRMKDVEYCCSIYILAREGIIDQTSDKRINAYYDDFKDVFDDDNMLTEKIIRGTEIISNLGDKKTIQFISKKAQMYSMFCMVFSMIDNNIEFSSEIFEKFKLFVTAYNLFRNEYNLNIEDPAVRDIYEGIKKYKLASSEGINKIGNRVIRFEILNKFCIEGHIEIKDCFRNLIRIFESQDNISDVAFEELEKEDLVDNGENDG